MSQPQDPTTAALMQIVSLTLCLESFDGFGKCTVQNKMKSPKDLKRGGKCEPAWEAFIACRQEKVGEVVGWCLTAEGCHDWRNTYFMCMQTNGADKGSVHYDKAHVTCMAPYEQLMRCGTASILRQLDPPKT